MRNPRARDDDLLRNEPRLIAGIRAGDARCIESFVRGSHRAVFAFAVRLTLDRDRREEWAHVALLRILDDVRTGRFVLRHPGAFWSWFRSRAYFLVLEQCRTARRADGRIAPEVALDAVPDLSQFGAADPAREYERAALRADIEHCLERLAHPEHRSALTLLLDQDLGYDEIASALAAPLNTVKTWIRRGRIALRECLSRRWGLLSPDDRTATSGTGSDMFLRGDPP